MKRWSKDCLAKAYPLFILYTLTAIFAGLLATTAWAYDPGNCAATDESDLINAMALYNNQDVPDCKKAIVLTANKTYTLSAPLVFSNNSSSVSNFKFYSTAGSILTDNGSFAADSALVMFKGTTVGTQTGTVESKDGSGKVINSYPTYSMEVSSISFSPVSAAALALQGSRNFYIHDMTITGASGGKAPAGIYLDGSSTITIQGVTLQSLPADGIDVVSSDTSILYSVTAKTLAGTAILLSDSYSIQIAGKSDALTLLQGIGTGISIEGASSSNTVAYTTISNFSALGFSLHYLTTGSSQGNIFDFDTTKISNSSIASITLADGTAVENPYVVSNVPSSTLKVEIESWSLDTTDDEYQVVTSLSGSDRANVKDVSLFLENPNDAGNTLLYTCEFVTTANSSDDTNTENCSDTIQDTMTFTFSATEETSDNLYAVVKTGSNELSNASAPRSRADDTTDESGSGSSNGGVYYSDCDTNASPPIWKHANNDLDQDGLLNVGSVLYESVDGSTYYRYADIQNGLIAGVDTTTSVKSKIYAGEDANNDCYRDTFSISIVLFDSSGVAQSAKTITIRETDAANFDSDYDCIPDGAECGTSCNDDEATTGIYVALDVDSDKDGLCDGSVYVSSGNMSTDQTACKTLTTSKSTSCTGVEDVNHDGQQSGDETNLRKADTDDDGLTDSQELEYGTNPLDADTDDDGEADGSDSQPTNSLNSYSYDNCIPNVGYLNPDQDTDGDSLTDSKEDVNHDCMYNAGTETDARVTDTDGDGLSDGIESGGSKTSPLNPDTDGDNILDGTEDTNHNGIKDITESDPTKTDTDGDGIADGTEDKNRNGVWDSGETKTYDSDTDVDGLADGSEDKNHNGVVDTDETDPTQTDSDGDGASDSSDCNPTNPYQSKTCSSSGYTDIDADNDDDGISNETEDANHNGKWDQGSETNFASADTDGDGIDDNVEPNYCRTYEETKVCYSAIDADTDGDGLDDGVEDVNGNGKVDTNETDPLNADTDGDGIVDGQDPEPLFASSDTDSDGDLLSDGIEDENDNGHVDSGETDPNNADTDGDGISDGDEDCDKDGSFESGNNSSQDVESDPLRKDTDGDGLDDGQEYRGNCTYSTTQTDPNDPDTDSDGLSDGDEKLVYGTDPTDPDTNHNGVNDFSEEVRNETSGCSLVAEGGRHPSNAPAGIGFIVIFGMAGVWAWRKRLAALDRTQLSLQPAR